MNSRESATAPSVVENRVGEAAHEAGNPALISGVARELYGALKAAGGGHLHYAAVVTVLERMAGMEAPREPRRVSAPEAEDRAGTSRAPEPS